MFKYVKYVYYNLLCKISFIYVNVYYIYMYICNIPWHLEYILHYDLILSICFEHLLVLKDVIYFIINVF